MTYQLTDEAIQALLDETTLRAIEARDWLERMNNVRCG